MSKLTNENLSHLIKGLKEYKSKGLADPWILSDGTIIEPLDVCIELQKLRQNLAGGNDLQPSDLEIKMPVTLRRKQ